MTFYKTVKMLVDNQENRNCKKQIITYRILDVRTEVPKVCNNFCSNI